MKNNRIIDAINRIEPSEEEQQHILDKIKLSVESDSSNSYNKPAKKVIKWFIPITACAIAMLLIIPYLTNNAKFNAKSFNQSSGNSSNLSDTESFKGFVLTAYAAKQAGDILTTDYTSATIPTEMQPNVDILLASYTPAMSSVPGFPFTFSTYQKTLSLKITVNEGELLKWETQSGKITNCGDSVVCKNGETLYWSPISEMVTDAQITVTALDGETDVGKQTISIAYSDNYYKATVGKVETL